MMLKYMSLDYFCERSRTCHFSELESSAFSSKSKTLVKKNLMDMLSKNGFPKDDLSVDQVRCRFQVKYQMSNSNGV